jgi:Protein kinase domain
MPDAPRVGTEFAGYLIEAVAGRGGMGTVYRAENRRLGNRVALKILAADLAADESFRERFVRESRLAASISHPNIIPIFDAGSEEDNLYIVMRYVDGADLKQVLKDAGPLPVDVTVSIVSQAGRGLAAAHARGLIHRDVKPANILLDFTDGDDPRLAHSYVADFGLTKHLGSVSGATGTGQLVGTLDYVSPEQISGGVLDARTDVYSLGCVLYECLAGHVPFPGSGDAAVLWAHMSETPIQPSALRGDVSTAVDAVVERAMAKDVGTRFGSCREMVAALESAAAATSLPATRPIELPVRLAPLPAPVVAATPAGGTPRRGTWMTVAACAVALLAVAGAGLLLLRDARSGHSQASTQPSREPRSGLERSLAAVVPLGSCLPPTAATGVETILCNNPLPEIAQLKVQQYTTWRYLYRDYRGILSAAARRDTDLHGLNSGSCKLAWETEDAWTYSGDQHDVPLNEQAMTANHDRSLNADGRVFCWRNRSGQPEIVWTNSKDGYLLIQAVGRGSHPSLAAWWSRAHTLLTPPLLGST